MSANSGFLIEGHFKDFISKYHFHDELTVGMVTDGCEELTIGKRKYVASAGSAYVIPPRAAHSYRPLSISGWTFRSIHIPVVIADRILARGWNAALKRCGDGFVRMERAPYDAARIIIEEGMHKGVKAGQSKDFDTSLRTLIGIIIGTQNRKPHRCAPDIVDKAKILFSLKGGHSSTLTDVSNALGVSPSHLVRAFSKSEGITPYAFAVSNRLNRAKAALLGGATLADAACQAGFYDQSQMTRHFKQTLGLTPGQFLRDCPIRWG